MVYRPKRGFHLSVPAQVVGEECERLESEGRLTPRDLVDESRPDDAPLHKAFEWDDSIAAEKYREAQASYLIRSVEVVVQESTEPTRAFVYTVSDDDREYRSIGYVLRSSESREALLEQAKRELLSFKRKYQTLYELSSVFDAIEGVTGSQAVLELTA